jgi:hypothetical protein
LAPILCWWKSSSCLEATDLAGIGELQAGPAPQGAILGGEGRERCAVATLERRSANLRAADAGGERLCAHKTLRKVLCTSRGTSPSWKTTLSYRKLAGRESRRHRRLWTNVSYECKEGPPRTRENTALELPGKGSRT